MLYRRRMERQLAAARGLGPLGEKPPDEDGAGGASLPQAGAKGGYVPPSVRWASAPWPLAAPLPLLESAAEHPVLPDAVLHCVCSLQSSRRWFNAAGSGIVTCICCDMRSFPCC